MTWSSIRNISMATAGALREIVQNGEVVVVRGSEVREVRNRVTVLTAPRERCLFVPFRRNSVVASVAETLWVLAGRNDIAWLSTYLPRASDYSDNGDTWHGGYGPRLRRWGGVDQIAMVRSLLLADRTSRRAVMSIFDPARDYASSKDIPCNNWLHWMVRGGCLHLNVAVRSNDVWWGFSGVNSFEWSVLQELMARWVGLPTGDLTFFASSLHLYQRHYTAADKALAAFRGVTCYDHGVEPAALTTGWESFDSAVSAWFETEARVRASPNAALNAGDLWDDPFLRTSLLLLRADLGARGGWSDERLARELAEFPENDLTAAGYEYFGRSRPAILKDIPHAGIASFLAEYHRSAAETGTGPAARIKGGVKALHREKDAAYQNAWKRRGELVSTLANIARKVDRLEVSARNGTTLTDEAIMDTAVDLFVYLTKYRLWLLESFPDTMGPHLLPSGAQPYSDHVSNFDTLVDAAPTAAPMNDQTPALVHEIMARFELLNGLAVEGKDSRERLEAANGLAALAWRLVLALASEQPERLGYFDTSAG